MDEFWISLQSANWWLGVVAVSLVINLASAYIKSPIDNLLSKLSRRWARRSFRSARAFSRTARAIANHPELQAICEGEEGRYRHREIVWLLFGCILVLAVVATRIFPPIESFAFSVSIHPRLVVLFAAAIPMVFGLHNRMAAERRANLLEYGLLLRLHANRSFKSKLLRSST